MDKSYHISEIEIIDNLCLKVEILVEIYVGPKGAQFLRIFFPPNPSFPRTTNKTILVILDLRMIKLKNDL